MHPRHALRPQGLLRHGHALLHAQRGGQRGSAVGEVRRRLIQYSSIAIAILYVACFLLCTNDFFGCRPISDFTTQEFCFNTISFTYNNNSFWHVALTRTAELTACTVCPFPFRFNNVLKWCEYRGGSFKKLPSVCFANPSFLSSTFSHFLCPCISGCISSAYFSRRRERNLRCFFKHGVVRVQCSSCHLRNVCLKFLCAVSTENAVIKWT